MVDVLVEGSEGLDEEVGFVLNEDTILLTFPFSALVPAALEARNKLLLGTESEAGTHAWSGSSECIRPAGSLEGRRWASRGSGNNCCKPKAARVQTHQSDSCTAGRAQCAGIRGLEADSAVGVMGHLTDEPEIVCLHGCRQLRSHQCFPFGLYS